MILTVDVGNTRIKGAVFENDTLLWQFVFTKIELQTALENILNQFQNITHLIVASVGDLEKKAFLHFENRIEIKFLTHGDPFPFTNTYETPLTLGIDRMVLSAGAVLTYPDENCLIIDAGTCITYDFVDSQQNYLGGAISPGLRLRYEALHHYTAKLPLLAVEDPGNYIGKSTNNAIHSGVVNGVVGEIDWFISRYTADYPKFTIILTGGDAEFLAKRLKNTIFANSNFLLESLNLLYQYSITND